MKATAEFAADLEVARLRKAHDERLEFLRRERPADFKIMTDYFWREPECHLRECCPAAQGEKAVRP